MSASVLMQEGLLTVEGDADAINKITLSLARNGKDIAVKDARGVVSRVAMAEVERIEVKGGLKRDFIQISPKLAINATIYGNAGDDTLVAGGGVDVVYGGSGNDTVKLGYNDAYVDLEGANRIVRVARPTNEGNHNAIETVATITSAELEANFSGGSTGATPTTPGELYEDDGVPAPAPVNGAQAATTVPAVTGLTLIDATADDALFPIANGMTINLAKLEHRTLNVRAEVNASVKSVKFSLDGNDRLAVENATPFALMSNTGGNYHGWTPSVGTHTVKVTAYAGANATGAASATRTVTFRVVDDAAQYPVSTVAPAVNSLTLVNATTDKGIGVLSDGATIDLNAARSLSIMANVNSATKSVRFGYDANANYRIENYAPFSFNGDGNRGTDLYSWIPTVGKHTVTVTAYGKSNGGGAASSTYRVTFTVVDTKNTNTGNTGGGSVTNPPPAPAPADADIDVTPATGGNRAPTISFINPTDGSAQAYPGHYVIRTAAADADGSVANVEFFVNGRLIDSTGDAPYSTSWFNVAAGNYTLVARATDDDGASTLSTINVTINAPEVDDVFYVGPNGSNDNGGRSSSNAFKSINHAASLAGPGDTIVVLPGTYRESIILKTSGTATAPITIKAQTPGTVVIDGSTELSGWQRDGSNGNVYSTDWNLDFFFQGSTSRYNYNHGTQVAGYAEQFMYEGKALKQVLNKADLSAGEFFVDWSKDKVHVWLPNNDDPRAAGNTVLGGNRSTLMAAAYSGTGKYITVDGLTFRHAANFAQQPAVRTTDGWVLKNTTIEKVGAVALGVYGNNNLVQNVKLLNNGQEGVMGTGTNALMVDTELAGNNYKDYRIAWEAGGGKMTRTQGLYVLNMNAHDNVGPGFWLDVFNVDYVIKGGYFHNNVGSKYEWEGMGLMIEISDGPGRVEGASFYANSGIGISLAESSGVTIRNNYFANRLEFRNMLGRGYSVRNIQVEGNRFERAAITTSIGKWTSNPFRDYNITTNNNTFENYGADIYQINGVKLKTALDVYTRFGVEKDGLLAAVTIPRAA